MAKGRKKLHVVHHGDRYVVGYWDASSKSKAFGDAFRSYGHRATMVEAITLAMKVANADPSVKW